ncbi:MAG: hypothetical protein FWF88_13140, partial [Peptococcaceae bacterium]|nr:hypothetical protein [Peptococcaceae bacterium]
KEEFSILEEMNFNVVNLTLKQYAEMAIENNKQDSVVREENGLISFEYQREMNGKITASFATIFKGSDAFWLVQFSCDQKDYEKYKTNKFIKWAKSFTVEPFDAESRDPSLINTTFSEATGCSMVGFLKLI